MEEKMLKQSNKNSSSESEVKETGKKDEKFEQKKISISTFVGPITDDKISLVSCTAMLLFIMTTAIMAVFAINKKSIDFTMNTFPDIIKYFTIPMMCILIFVVYLMVIDKIDTDGKSVFKVIRSNPLFIVFAAAVVMMLASQIYNGMEYALSGFCSASIAETFPMEIAYFVFILFGAAQIRKKSHKRLITRFQVIVSMILVVAAFALWHSQVESTFFYDWTPRFSSIYSNTNYYGYYLVVSASLAAAYFLHEKCMIWKIIAAISFMANTVALSLCNCRGSWLGAAFAIIFLVIAHYIIEKKVNWQALALIPVFIICLYLPGHIVGSFDNQIARLGTDIASVISGAEGSDSAGSSRVLIWKESLKIANENSMLGIGFEGVKYWEFQGPPYNIRPHNEFIQYALFHGYPMAILYFIGCLGVFIRALRKKYIMNGETLACLAAAFGYLVSSFFGLTVFSTAAYLFIFLGMGYVRDDDAAAVE